MQKSIDKCTAGFFTRAAAYIIDLIIIQICLMAIRIPMFFVNLFVDNNILYNPFIFNITPWKIFIYILSVLYFILFTYNKAATPGKMLLRIKVTRKDGKKVTLMQTAYRETIGRYLSGILYVGYIYAGLDQENRGFHDLLADTKVIYAIQKPVRKYLPADSFYERKSELEGGNVNENV